MHVHDVTCVYVEGIHVAVTPMWRKCVSMFMYMWNACVYEGDHMHVEVSTCVFK